MALPEVTERLSHGAPTWFVRGKSAHLWCASSPELQQELIAGEPRKFFRPPYVGGRGWVGVRLDRDPDWAEISELCRDAYRVVAPTRLAARLDS